MDQDRIDVKTPFGSVKASGNMVVLIVVLIAGFGGLGWVLLRTMEAHDKGGMERGAKISQQVDDLKDAINEQTFVLTLSQQKREELRLDMPESLRRKVGR